MCSPLDGNSLVTSGSRDIGRAVARSEAPLGGHALDPYGSVVITPTAQETPVSPSPQ